MMDGSLAGAAAASTEGLRFPPGFVWGTSTSAYQIEGRTGRRGDCIWDTFCRLPGKIKDGSTGDVACDDYRRYPDDIALIRDAGLKAYRFSVAWARVLPAGVGAPDADGLDYYSRLVDALLEAGIAPWLCLYHWDLPQALQDRGGWTVRDTAERFADYAALMARRLGDRVRRWATFNEPMVHGVMGHGLGQHAPGLHGLAPMFAALHHQNLAHGAGVEALRAVGGSRFRIGTVLNVTPVRPAGGEEANVPAARMWDALWNRASLDPPFLGHYPELLAHSFEPLVRTGDLARIRQPLDFLGLNYYGPMYQRNDPSGLVGTNWGAMPAGMDRTKLGWSIDPDGLIEVLADFRDHYGNPRVYVTENGACFADAPGPDGRVDDRQRIAYLQAHISACHRAIAQGANLHGYFTWTLGDNFEWAEGYSARFGLVHVDRASLQRTPKASYRWYAQVARGGGA
jgi:beta-glucosidase